jgi:hypothetical protein
MINPAEISQEKGISIEPHATIIMNQKKSDEIGKVLTAKRIFGIFTNNLHPHSRLLRDEICVVLICEKPELPTTFFAEVLHVVHA